jgi:ankyrin repeat protein
VFFLRITGEVGISGKLATYHEELKRAGPNYHMQEPPNKRSRTDESCNSVDTTTTEIDSDDGQYMDTNRSVNLRESKQGDEQMYALVKGDLDPKILAELVGQCGLGTVTSTIDDDDQSTFLHLITKGGSTALMDIVWKHDPQVYVTTKDIHGCTVIHRPMPFPAFDWILRKSLEENKMDIFEQVNFNGDSVVHCLARCGNIPCLQRLFEEWRPIGTIAVAMVAEEARESNAFEGGSTDPDHSCPWSALFSRRNYNGELPVHIAAENGRVDVLEFYYLRFQDGKDLLLDMGRENLTRPVDSDNEEVRTWMNISSVYSSDNYWETSILQKLQRICNLRGIIQVRGPLKEILKAAVANDHVQILEWIFNVDSSILMESFPGTTEIPSSIREWHNLSKAIETINLEAIKRILRIGKPIFGHYPVPLPCRFDFGTFFSEFKDSLRKPQVYENLEGIIRALTCPLSRGKIQVLPLHFASDENGGAGVLHLIAEIGCWKAIAILVEHKSEDDDKLKFLETLDAHGRNIVHWYSKSSSTALGTEFLDELHSFWPKSQINRWYSLISGSHSSSARPPSAWSPAHFAAFCGNSVSLNFLCKWLGRQAVCRSRNSYHGFPSGVTSLHLAAASGNTECLKILLELAQLSISNPDSESQGLEGILRSEDDEGHTIAHMAARFNRHNILTMLCSFLHSSAVAMSTQSVAQLFLHKAHVDGTTCIHIAAAHRSNLLLDELVRNLDGSNGWALFVPAWEFDCNMNTPAHHLFLACHDLSSLDDFTMLRESANVLQHCPITRPHFGLLNAQGKTPLHLLCEAHTRSRGFSRWMLASVISLLISSLQLQELLMSESVGDLSQVLTSIVDAWNNGDYGEYTSYRHVNTKVLKIDRRRLLSTSKSELEQLGASYSDRLKAGQFSVKFIDEIGSDVGGLTRDWIGSLGKQLFGTSRSVGLFLPGGSCEGCQTINPRPYILEQGDFDCQRGGVDAALLNSDAHMPPILPNAGLDWYELCGTVIGIALAKNLCLGVLLAPAICKQLLGMRPGFDDLEASEYELYSTFRALTITGDNERLQNVINHLNRGLYEPFRPEDHGRSMGVMSRAARVKARLVAHLVKSAACLGSSESMQHSYAAISTALDSAMDHCGQARQFSDIADCSRLTIENAARFLQLLVQKVLCDDLQGMVQSMLVGLHRVIPEEELRQRFRGAACSAGPPTPAGEPGAAGTGSKVSGWKALQQLLQGSSSVAVDDWRRVVKHTVMAPGGREERLGVGDGAGRDDSGADSSGEDTETVGGGASAPAGGDGVAPCAGAETARQTVGGAGPFTPASALVLRVLPRLKT